jgi:ABC-2 type transport system ATP-binding protein
MSIGGQVTDTVLELQGVSKSFKQQSVLERIDFSVSRGSVVGLLGKNGAGKTTLLKCALGLLKTTAGTSRIFGEDSWDLSAATKARIGYVPQKLDFYVWMKVRQMIAYYGAFYPAWNDALTSSLIRNWELDPESLIGKLSEGQVQKLGLILAMGHEPDLLILDEPAASLDPQARRTFLAAVVEIAGNHNRTVILSTHLTSDLERVASDIVLLKSGVISYSGSMDELKDSVKSLTLTTERALPAVLDLPGMLRCDVRGNHAVLTMQGVTPDTIRILESKYAATVETRDLTLEDIFVEVHRA